MSQKIVTAGFMRNLLSNRAISDDCVLCICVDEYEYAPIVQAKFDGPLDPNEDNLGVILLRPDPDSEIGVILGEYPEGRL